MNGIVVSVDYAGELALTLPRASPHFDRIVVISTPQDHATAAVVRSIPNAELFLTDAFYRRGALFNKWLALEEGFDRLGREGWVVVMDADVVVPKNCGQALAAVVQSGCLYTPRRRMLYEPAGVDVDRLDWKTLPLHQDTEFAGYFQCFSCDDPVLGRPPWWDVNWRHAGGADSYFAMKWKRRNQVRPNFEVLHLGVDGANWCGRSTPRLDGSLPPDAAARAAQLKDFIDGRGRGPGRFDREKIG